jgi:hypothetical protein
LKWRGFAPRRTGENWLRSLLREPEIGDGLEGPDQILVEFGTHIDQNLVRRLTCSP